MILPAWQVDTQEVIQIFARSDRKFNGRETIHSASVTTDRSGNERAISRCQQSGYIKRGLHKNGNPNLMNNV